MRSKKQEVRSKKFRRGFSLVEVLLAMFILGIGMIMVASVFPVGANWTRQTTEESVAQTVVQDALTVLRTHYGPNGNLRYYFNSDYLTYDTSGTLAPNNPPNNYNSILQNRDPPVVMNINGSDVAVRWPFVVQALPGFLNIPPEERAYQFGSSTPFPARNWKQCTYFWTALARLNPVHRNVGWAGSDWTNGIIPSSSYNYDVYIMVFRKGAVEQSFTTDKLPSGVSELAGTRNTGGAVTYSDTDYVRLIPPVGGASYIPGAYAGGGNWSTVARPALGEMGIGAVSGTVFKQVLSDDFSNAVPRPDLIRDTNKPYPVVEPMFFSPAADNTNASPLIYIYQTTMTF